MAKQNLQKWQLNKLNALLATLNKSGMKEAKELGNYLKTKTPLSYWTGAQSEQDLEKLFNDKVVSLVPTNPHLSDEDKMGYYSKYDNKPLKTLNWEQMLKDGEIVLGEGLTPERRIQLAAKHGFHTVKDFNTALTNARIEWNAIQQGKVPEQIKQARKDALHDDSPFRLAGIGPEVNLPGDQWISEIMVPRSYESADNQIEAGESPEVDKAALTGDVVDLSTSFIPGPSGALKGFRFMKNLEQGGKAKKAANVALHAVADAGKDVTGTVAAETIAGQSASYDFNPTNVVMSGVGSAIMPIGAAGLSNILHKFPWARPFAEAIEKSSKEYEHLPAAEKMKIESTLEAFGEKAEEAAAIEKRLEQMSKSGNTEGMAELQIKYAQVQNQMEKRATELVNSYPSVFKKETPEVTTLTFKDANGNVHTSSLDPNPKAEPVQPVINSKDQSVNKGFTKAKQNKADKKFQEGTEADIKKQQEYEAGNETNRSKLLADDEAPDGTTQPLYKNLNGNEVQKRVEAEAQKRGLFGKKGKELNRKETFNPTQEEASLLYWPKDKPGAASTIVHTIIEPTSRISAENSPDLVPFDIPLTTREEHQEQTQKEISEDPERVKAIHDANKARREAQARAEDEAQRRLEEKKENERLLAEKRAQKREPVPTRWYRGYHTPMETEEYERWLAEQEVIKRARAEAGLEPDTSLFVDAQ